MRGGENDCEVGMLRGGENDCEVGMLFVSFFQGGENDCEVGMLFPSFFQGGENDCEVGVLFPSFFQGGVSAKPTGWLVWIYTHTIPGLRPTPPLERRGKQLRGRGALPLLFSRRGVGEADGVVGADLHPHHPWPAADPSS